MEKEKLKPCPFCGGQAHVMKMGYPHWVYCEDCGAKVQGFVAGSLGEQASIALWNSRYNELPEGVGAVANTLPKNADDVLNVTFSSGEYHFTNTLLVFRKEGERIRVLRDLHGDQAKKAYRFLTEANSRIQVLFSEDSLYADIAEKEGEE